MSLFDKIDETAASDADYITTSTAGSVAEMQLGSVTDPGVDTLHSIKLRASGSGSLQVDLVQGSGALLTIWTSKTRTQQPQAALGVDKSNANAAKVGILIARGEARNYAVGGPAATATARIPIVAGTQGLAGTLSNSAYLTFPASSMTTGPEYSVLTVIRPSGGGVFFDCGNFRIQLLNSFTDTRVQVDKAGVVQLIDAGLGAGTIGTWLVIAVTYNATTGAVTVSANNGVRASATSAQTLTNGTAVLGNCSSVSNDVALFAFAQTEWDSRQITSLLGNPWQLLSPETRPRHIPAAKPIASRTIPLIATPTDYRRELLPAEAALITNYADLRVRFRGV